MTSTESNDQRLRHLADSGDAEAISRLLMISRRRADLSLERFAEGAATRAFSSAREANDPIRAIEALLCLPPDPARWRRLIEALELDAPRRDIDLATERAQRRLTQWPDELRVVPESWWRKVLSEAPTPLGLALTRSLNLEGLFAPSDLETLAREPLLQITRLRLAPAVTSNRNALHQAIVVLLHAPPCEPLRHLSLHRCHLRDSGLTAIAPVPVFGHLESLALEHNQLRNQAIEDLAHTRALPLLKSLSLAHNLIDDDTFSALLSSPSLDTLEQLDLSDNPRIEPHGANAFIRPSRVLSGVQRLNMSRCQLSNAGLIALSRAPSLGDLTTLQLDHNQIGPAGVRALTNSRTLGRLKSLSLNANDLRDASLMALSHWQRGHTLEALSLVQNRIQPPGIGALARAQGLSNLHTLNLSSNLLGDRGVGSLTNRPQLPMLRCLLLSSTATGDAGARSLAAAPFHLEQLDLSNPMERRRSAGLSNNIGPSGCAAIAQSRSITRRLSILSLAFNPIGDQGAAALAGSPELTTLTSLDLRGCGLHSEGAIALATSDYLTGLKHLRLRDNAIGPAAAAAIARSSNLSGLDSLEVTSRDVGDEGMALLAKRFRIRT